MTYSVIDSITKDLNFFIGFIYKVYLSISSLYFKDAVHCINPFHVVKLINDALNRVRKCILRLYSTEEGKEKIEYKLLKHRYKVLSKKKKK